VARDGLLLAQPIDLGLSEVTVERAKALLVGIRERRGLEQRAVGERDEPLDLDLDPRTVEAGLGEEVGETGDGGAVAAVEGAQGLRRERSLEIQGRSS